jgi:hypothetical protein
VLNARIIDQDIDLPERGDGIGNEAGSSLAIHQIGIIIGNAHAVAV